MFTIDDENTSQITDQTSANFRLVKESCKHIEHLYEKYENDLYMVSKINHYIANQLPHLLETISESRIKSQQRNIEHSDEQDKFMYRFLSSHKYYYHSTNERYFQYNGPHYSETCEDGILHCIITAISQENNPVLMNWKHKTKVSLLKRIKDQPIMKSIPESDTIQMVIQQLCPTICSSKTETKHFLSVIGDNILRKSSSLIYFVNPSIKSFFTQLNEFCLDKFNVQCAQTFKYKYHEKHYENDKDCRLIHFNPQIQHCSYDTIVPLYGLDILCVAVHYSNKYGSADDYLQEFCQDNELHDYVFRLKISKPQSIVSHFANEYLINFRKENSSLSVSPQEEYFLQNKIVCWENNTKILSWRHIQYLWKDYLAKQRYPSNLYGNLNKKILVENIYPLQYNEQMDAFQDVGSSHIPLIQKFLTFWGETIIPDESECAELETEEIGLLFRNWLSKHQKKQKYLLKENKMVDILEYFHPELEISNGKYVMNVRNLLWDKDMDIEMALGQLKENTESISLYESYQYYCKFYSQNKEDKRKPLLVSKSFFEKYVRKQYGHHLNDDDIFIWKGEHISPKSFDL